MRQEQLSQSVRVRSFARWLLHTVSSHVKRAIGFDQMPLVPQYLVVRLLIVIVCLL